MYCGLQPYVVRAVTVCRLGLQPYAVRAVTVCRLGLRHYKTELADLAFKHLFPAEFDEIEARHIYGCSPSYIRLQPALHTVTVRVTYGCSPRYIRLQPAVRTVAARATYGYCPHYIRLQPAVYTVAGAHRRQAPPVRRDALRGRCRAGGAAAGVRAAARGARGEGQEGGRASPVPVASGEGGATASWRVEGSGGTRTSCGRDAHASCTIL